MANRETKIQQEIRLAVSRGNVRVFRNNTGMIDGVQFGLCVGSSDLIGFKTVTVTPEMVGSRVAIFTALEVKTEKGRVSQGQQNFIDTVLNAGGIASVVRSVDDAIEVLNV